MGNRSIPRHVLRHRPRDTRALTAACLGVVLVTLIVFWPVSLFDFVNYDDLEFIVENPHVSTGLRTDNVTWAFANAYTATGGPLTWLSHMADVEAFGMDAGRQHVVSLVFHLCNALVLLMVLWRMTGAVWRSACVSVLFAVHPLHVESVAWVAERKDVLSTLFWLLTMSAYVAYARRPGPRRYAAVLVLFLLGLLSKPMVATLPFVLLLIDVWPLERLSPGDGFWRHARRLTLEKLPLMLLAAVCLALTIAAQHQIGAVAAFEELPLRIRLSNAAVSYLAYIGKMIWPQGLAAFYPYRSSLPAPLVFGCAAAIGGLSVAAIAAVGRAPYLTVGWLWYIGTLVPVIGIVQLGGHAMADRFTYIPLMGVFILLSWGVPALLARIGLSTASAVVVPAVAVVAYAVAARGQVMHWQNGTSLWEHAIRVTPDNARAHANLGVSLAGEGRRASAITEYQEALRLEPRMAETHNNLALVLVDVGASEDALAHYREAVRLKPDYPNAHTNLANLLDEKGWTDEAIQHYGEAIRLKPNHVLARVNLAIALAKVGRVAEAIGQLEEALRADPSNGPARKMIEDMRRLATTS